MVARALVLAAVVLGSAHAARADKLADARVALDAVRYADAEPLLVAALHDGGNSPTRVLELYRLLASTATVLGQRDAAEGYYRRWLELEPTASLPDTVAPKLREPFVAAQVYMAARAALSASAALQGSVVEVVVASDPLAMVAAVDIAGARRTLGVDRHAHGQAPSGARQVDVALLDEFANHLVELTAVADTSAVSDSPAIAAPSEPVATSVPLWREPWTWGSSVVVFGLVGGGLALAARNANSQLSTIIATSGDYYLSDAQSAQQNRDQDATLANVSLAIAGACAITGAIMYAIHPHRHVAPGLGSITVAW